MKKLLFISLMILATACKGQELKLLNDSIAIAQGDTFPAPLSFLTLQNQWHHEIEPGKLDTVTCMMLVTDSTIINGASYYLKGYQVNIGASDNYNEFHYWEFVKYIDADKKPLSKNIIVWLTK